MSEPIVYVDHSDVREGRLEELLSAIAELARFVEEAEPGLLAYRVHLSEDRTRMSVVHVHAGASSLEHHMEVAGPRFARFADLVELRGIDVYGAPGPRLLERLEGKARTLGAGAVVVHEPHAGFARLRAA